MNGFVNEGASASDSIESMAEFHSSIQELINAASTTSAAAHFIASVNEFAQGLDSPTRRLLWEVINTSESTTWDTINNSESTAWGTINTSDTGGWQVIKTQP